MKNSKFIELSNQKRLAEEYAENTECPEHVRIYAIGKIFVKSILADIIENTSEEFIREACLKKMYYYDYLFKMACDDTNWRNRLIAMSTLMAFFLLTEDSRLIDCRDEILDNEAYRDYPASDNLQNIALNDEDWKNRLAATLMIDDASILENIALNDESKYLRIAALFKIDNNDKLVEIIENDQDVDVVDMACKKLDDESRLVEIYPQRMKTAILRNIHDQFILIDSIYGSDDWGECIEISKNIYNPKVLYDMIVGESFQSKYRPVQRFTSFSDDYVYFEDLMGHVFSLINDDELQREIVINTSSYVVEAIEHIGDAEICSELLNSFNYDCFPYSLNEKLADEDTLFNMALNHPSENVRFNAVLRIFDKSKLKVIIDNESVKKVKDQALWNLNLDESEFNLDNDNRFVRAEAVKAIKDEAKLVKILCYMHDDYISPVAINNIDDDELLADIACEMPLRFSKLAINKISNEKVLARIASDALDESNAAYAVTKINDDTILADVLDNSPYPRCHTVSVLRICDEEMLKDIAYNNDDDYLRNVAVSKIDSQDILKDFALNDSNFHIRQQAVERITDVSFLSDVSENDDSHSVRMAAKYTMKREGNV
ncbi:hypothetical protein [Methanobrevibacter sp.]|uniref:hypothetical protein n=1 Tax=Methanobrevibacter sp. TaxID=66852 RepID=UPI00386441C9